MRSLTRDAHEEGFGLIEMVVAMLIAGIVFSALATTLIAGLQASLFGRQNQQATDLMTAQLEQLRAMPFGSLTMSSADVAGDPRVGTCGGAPCLATSGEPIVLASPAGVATHVTTVDVTDTNNTIFTVSSYLTVSDQPVTQAVRATVYVTWVNKGQTQERSTSSIIAYTQRGLPLPRFKLELPVAALAVNPGGQLTYELTLLNQGAPDRWDIALSGSTSGWSLFADSDNDGTLTGADAALSDTSLNGVVDTGRIDPSTTFRFFLTRTTTAAATLGTFDTVVTATSVGQPSAAEGSASVTATSTITTGVITPTPTPSPSPTTTPPTTEITCAAATAGTVTGVGTGGYSVYQYTLHNDGIGPSPLQPQMYFNGNLADETILERYSTDVDNAATGRVIESVGGSAPSASSVMSLSDTEKYADWLMTVDQKSWLDGTGVLRIWVAAHDGAMPSGATLVLYSAASASGARTVLASVDVTIPSGCAGFQEVYLTLPDIPQPQVAKNGVFGVRLVVSGDDGRLGYDVPGQMPASLQIGVK